MARQPTLSLRHKLTELNKVPVSTVALLQTPDNLGTGCWLILSITAVLLLAEGYNYLILGEVAHTYVNTLIAFGCQAPTKGEKDEDRTRDLVTTDSGAIRSAPTRNQYLSQKRRNDDNGQ
jgi:hypothetical protein